MLSFCSRVYTRWRTARLCTRLFCCRSRIYTYSKVNSELRRGVYNFLTICNMLPDVQPHQARCTCTSFAWSIQGTSCCMYIGEIKRTRQQKWSNYFIPWRHNSKSKLDTSSCQMLELYATLVTGQKLCVTCFNTKFEEVLTFLYFNLTRGIEV